MYKSNLYWSLRLRYLSRRLEALTPYVLLGLVCWAGWFYQMVNAVAYEGVKPIITLTLSN